MKNKKKGYSSEDIYVIISIAAVIFLFTFALNSVYAVKESMGRISSSSNELYPKMIKDENSLLVRNGTSIQLKKLELKYS